MKKLSCFLVLAICLSLYACGNVDDSVSPTYPTELKEPTIAPTTEESIVTGPSVDTLNNDLESSLTDYCYFLNLDEYIIERSITEDRTYSAVVSASAHSQYADFMLTGNIGYIKYDQGWFYNNCIWDITGFKVNSWPTEDDMNSFLANRASQVDDYLKQPEYYSLTNDGDTYLFYEGTINSIFSDFVGIEGDIVSIWEYNFQNDTFEFKRDNSSVKLTLLHDIEGTWLDERMSGSFGNYYFIITDQWPDHFTIEYTFEDYSETVYLVSDLSDFIENKCLVFENNTSDHRTTVTLSTRSDGYILHYQSNYDNSNYDLSMWAYID